MLKIYFMSTCRNINIWEFFTHSFLINLFVILLYDMCFSYRLLHVRKILSFLYVVWTSVGFQTRFNLLVNWRGIDERFFIKRNINWTLMQNILQLIKICAVFQILNFNMHKIFWHVSNSSFDIYWVSLRNCEIFKSFCIATMMVEYDIECNSFTSQRTFQYQRILNNRPPLYLHKSF